MNKLENKDENNIIDYRSKNNLQFRLWTKIFAWSAMPLVIAGCILFALDYFVYTNIKVIGLSVYAFIAYILLAFPLISNFIFFVISAVRELKWNRKTLGVGPLKGFHGRFLKKDDFDTTCDC